MALFSQLTVFVHPDVPDFGGITQLLLENGANVSAMLDPGVGCILVNPASRSCHSLYPAHLGGKLVLSYTWVYECIRTGRLLTVFSDLPGCKTPATTHPSLVESLSPSHEFPPPAVAAAAASIVPNTNNTSSPSFQNSSVYSPVSVSDYASLQQIPFSIDDWSQFADQPSIYQQWAPVANYDHQTLFQQPDHVSSSPRSTVLHQSQHQAQDPSPSDPCWTDPSHFPDPSSSQLPNQFHPSYQPSNDPIPPPPQSTTAVYDINQFFQPLDSTPPAIQPVSLPPTPVKNTSPDDVFTQEDLEFIQQYMQYCQENGVSLSLEELCQRIAIRAPHHSARTIQSQEPIMNFSMLIPSDTLVVDDSQAPTQSDPAVDNNTNNTNHSHSSSLQSHSGDSLPPPRESSPTPPRCLYRSTTGKGIAFTEEDISFLLRFMDHRRAQGRLDMSTFWNEVAEKAPHHSRASWMKYWRRHKHELEHDGGDEPLPVPPDKRFRYSQEDDILLARFFLRKPPGTLDEVFQQFGRLFPHHPWKGWQEHYRLNKSRIESLIPQLDDPQEQVNTFNKNGYLVVPNFLSSSTVEALLNRTKELLEGFSLDDHPKTKFKTGDDDHVGDDYFLTSGDKIRFFLEVDAVDSNGNLTRDKALAVNKIGHALHELDPEFRKVTLDNPSVKDVVRDLGLHKDPVALQSMIICKQPEIGGEVGPHNDSTFLYTDPPSAIGFWIALEECTAENGALSFLPGSHLTYPITKRFVRSAGGGTTFETLTNDAGVQPLPPQEEYILETCNPGDLVLIHGTVLHKSERNHSPRTRFAYTFHVIDTPPHAIYDDKNWLQPSSEMPFSRLFQD